MEQLSAEKQQLTYFWDFDVDGDGIFEQKIILKLDIPTIRFIGRKPSEYISFGSESDSKEDETTSEGLEDTVEDDLAEDRKVSIIYADESQNANEEPIIDTYLIFTGNGALLSVD